MSIGAGDSVDLTIKGPVIGLGFSF